MQEKRCFFLIFLPFLPIYTTTPPNGRVVEKFYFSIAKYSDAVITGILDRMKS